MRYIKDLRLSSMLKNRLEVWAIETAKEKINLGNIRNKKKSNLKYTGQFYHKLVDF